MKPKKSISLSWLRSITRGHYPLFAYPAGEHNEPFYKPLEANYVFIFDDSSQNNGFSQILSLSLSLSLFHSPQRSQSLACSFRLFLSPYSLVDIQNVPRYRLNPCASRPPATLLSRATPLLYAHAFGLMSGAIINKGMSITALSQFIRVTQQRKDAHVCVHAKVMRDQDDLSRKITA